MSSISQIPINNFRSSIKPFTTLFTVDPFKKILEYEKLFKTMEIDEKIKPKIKKYIDILVKYRSFSLRDKLNEYEFKNINFEQVLELIDYYVVLTTKNKKRTDENEIKQMIKK